MMFKVELSVKCFFDLSDLETLDMMALQVDCMVSHPGLTMMAPLSLLTIALVTNVSPWSPLWSLLLLRSEWPVSVLLVYSYSFVVMTPITGSPMIQTKPKPVGHYYQLKSSRPKYKKESFLLIVGYGDFR